MSTDLKRLEDTPIEALAILANEEAENAAKQWQQAKAMAKSAIRSGQIAGKCLSIIKQQLPHGQWLPWLEENWQHHRSWAARLMKLSNVECTLHLEDATSLSHALRLMDEAEEAAGTKRSRKSADPSPEVEVIDNRPAKPQEQPQTAPAMFDDTDDLPPEEPPALPKTNTLHSPATQQRIDRGLELAPPVAVSEDPLGDMIDATPFPTLISKMREKLAGCEDSHRVRIANMLQEFVNELNPPAETKAPTLPQMRAIIDERAKLPPADDRHLKPPVAAAASEWAAHKTSMPKAKRYQSRTSWEACLSRMATLSLDRGADVVCDMIQRAIASGYQGWEFETSAPRGGRQPMRSTNIRTGRNFDAEMGPPINLADVEEF